MKLSQLLEEVKHFGIQKDMDIGSLSSDTRNMEAGAAFVCIKGLSTDGHALAQKALEQGASVVIVERDLGLGDKQVLVENSRNAFALMCSAFYGHPSRSLKLVAVTGTTGKTTIASLIKSVLDHSGEKAGFIGTIRYQIGEDVLPAKYTTPDPLELHKILARMRDVGCEYAVMEASSQALDQHRLDGCSFEVAAFTNLSREHLDYHKDFEQYYQAKRKLFDMAKRAVICIDYDYGKRLAGEIAIPYLTTSVEQDQADFVAKNIRTKPDGVEFELVAVGMIKRIGLKIPGRFSVANALVAAACCISLGLSIDEIAAGIAACKGVKGRSELIETGQNFSVICDFAHTPDSLEKLLHSVKEFAKGRIVTLFGCAGMRDKTKRPVMGEIAGRLSDFVVLTSDNPRGENPEEILNEVEAGILPTKANYIKITDRYDAIHWAIQNAREDDTIILAGKGHEDYQVLDRFSIYFDEREIVKEALLKYYGEGKSQ